VAPRTPPLVSALRRACADFVAVRIPHALVGGLAVSARAEPRLTRDVDLAVAVETDADAEAIVRELSSRRYRVATILEQPRTGRLATARLEAPGGRILVDLLFATCGIEHEVVAAAEPIEILPGLIVPVARTGHLIAMKLLAADDRKRPQDLDDIRALLAVAGAAERRRVTVAITKIAARGFARGRDLRAMWRKILAEA
jgi:predicted nucleotidyltransferase